MFRRDEATFFCWTGDRDHLAQCESSLVSSPPSFQRIKESFDSPFVGGEKMVHLLVMSHESKELSPFLWFLLWRQKEKKKKQEENIGNHSDGLGGIKENPSACLLLLLFDPIRRIERNPLSAYILCIQPVQRTDRGGNEKKKVRSDTAHSSLVEET